jgi:predicted AlkP superfamily pyrophosphatase or phosphodiesterase
MNVKRNAIVILQLIGFLFCYSIQGQEIEHVILIGVDGMSPDGVRQADTPHLDQLMKTGAYSLHARGVMPTISGPNWASMLNGAGPEQHGVFNNGWKAGNKAIIPTAEGHVKGMFPSVFSQIRRERPKALLACVYDWDGIGRLVEVGIIDEAHDIKGSPATMKKAINVLKKKAPTFLFIHLDEVDHVGHDVGHGTPEYYASVTEADELIGSLIEALEKKGLRQNTVLMVTSDHGGRGKGHGSDSMADLEIPWIINGPGIKKGVELTRPINTFDTAVTVGHLLGIPPHPAWIGRPVLTALQKD